MYGNLTGAVCTAVCVASQLGKAYELSYDSLVASKSTITLG
jgi:hypothetical protein